MPGGGSLWAPIRDGWQLFWLMGDQPTAAEIEASREQARTRQKRKRHHNNGDHELCDPKACRVLLRLSRRDTPRDNQRDDPPPPSRPDSDPPRPIEERGGESADASDNPAGSIVGRSKDDRAAAALRLLDDPKSTEPARKAARKQLDVLGVVAP